MARDKLVSPNGEKMHALGNTNIKVTAERKTISVSQLSKYSLTSFSLHGQAKRESKKK